MNGEQILNLIIENAEILNQHVEAMRSADDMTIDYSNKKMLKRFRETQAFLSMSACEKLIEFSESIGEMLRKDNG